MSTFTALRDASWPLALLISGVSAFYGASNYYASRAREEPNVNFGSALLADPRADSTTFFVDMKNFGVGSAFDPVSLVYTYDLSKKYGTMILRLEMHNEVQSNTDYSTSKKVNAADFVNPIVFCNYFFDRDRKKMISHSFLRVQDLKLKEPNQTVGGERLSVTGVDSEEHAALEAASPCPASP